MTQRTTKPETETANPVHLLLFALWDVLAACKNLRRAHRRCKCWECYYSRGVRFAVESPTSGIEGEQLDLWGLQRLWKNLPPRRIDPQELAALNLEELTRETRQLIAEYGEPQGDADSPLVVRAEASRAG